MTEGVVKWQTFRPLREWVTVKADSRVKKTQGGLILTDELTKIERVMEGTGVVLRCGPKAARDIEPGERICYRGFLKDAFHQVFEREEDNCQIFLLDVKDILMAIPPGLDMGEWSGIMKREEAE